MGAPWGLSEPVGVQYNWLVRAVAVCRGSVVIIALQFGPPHHTVLRSTCSALPLSLSLVAPGGQLQARMVSGTDAGAGARVRGK